MPVGLLPVLIPVAVLTGIEHDIRTVAVIGPRLIFKLPDVVRNGYHRIGGD